MQKQLDPRIAVTIVVVLLLVVGLFAWRKAASNPASGSAISPEQAGLGKPVLPHIPSSNPTANAGATR